MPLYTSPYIIAADVRNHTNLYELAVFATESDSAAWARKFITNGLVPQVGGGGFAEGPPLYYTTICITKCLVLLGPRPRLPCYPRPPWCPSPCCFLPFGLAPCRLQDQDALSGLADAIVAARPPLVMVWAVYGGAVQTGRTGVVSRGMRQAMYQVGP